MHRLAHGVVSAERKRDIRHAAAHARMWQVLLDPFRRTEEIDRVVHVLLEPRRDGEDVRIENDVLRRNPYFLSQDAIGAYADFDSALEIVGLPALVEGHHDHRRAVAPHEPRVALEVLLADFERDGIDDALALHAFQPGFDHAPLRRVDHDRHARDVWLTRDEVQKARHRRLGIDHSLVHVDVENVRAALDLLPRDGERAFEIAGEDQLRKLWRAGDVRALADHHETHLGRDIQRLEAGKT